MFKLDEAPLTFLLPTARMFKPDPDEAPLTSLLPTTRIFNFLIENVS